MGDRYYSLLYPSIDIPRVILHEFTPSSSPGLAPPVSRSPSRMPRRPLFTGSHVCRDHHRCTGYRLFLLLYPWSVAGPWVEVGRRVCPPVVATGLGCSPHGSAKAACPRFGPQASLILRASLTRRSSRTPPPCAQHIAARNPTVKRLINRIVRRHQPRSLSDRGVFTLILRLTSPRRLKPPNDASPSSPAL